MAVNGEIPLFEIKESPVGGKGAFAATSIPKDTRVIEYKGDRKKWSDFKADDEAYVYLFSVGREMVIDPFSNGNEARFINHSCEPNCHAVTEKGRVFIESIRDIKPGEELFYDYGLRIGKRPTMADRKQYACRCGAAACRGTMLHLPPSLRKMALSRKS